MRISPLAVKCAAREIYSHLDWTHMGESITYNRRFRAIFGADPRNMARVWNAIDGAIEEQADTSEIYWLMVTMHWMKTYPTIDNLATTIGKDPKTVRTYLWKYTDLMARLEVVCELSLINLNDSVAYQRKSNRAKARCKLRLRGIRLTLLDIEQNYNRILMKLVVMNLMNQC